MPQRLLTMLEALIFVTAFALFASFVITTNTNDTITEQTESFVETVRYKGCITQEMYSELIAGCPVPIDVGFVATRYEALSGLEKKEFTGDVVNALVNDSSDLSLGIIAHTYTLNAGDDIEVIVRKVSPSFFDTVLQAIGQRGFVSVEHPAIAIKGGMILNTQYAGG